MRQNWRRLTRKALALRIIAAGAPAMVLVLVLLWIAPPASGQKPAVPAGPVSIQVQASPIAGFQARDPQRRQFGMLEFRGGLELRSTYGDFGGISSIRMEADGQRFLAVTDRGNWLSGRLLYSGTAPAGMADVVIAPILASDGRPITTRRWYDSEALTVEDGKAYVALERVHRILWFDYGRDGLLARGQPLRVPPEFKQLPSNKGIEGLVVVPKGMPNAGALLAISERGLDAAGNTLGFLVGGPNAGSFAIVRRDDDFDVTDAALTPRGDLLILERSFSLLRGVGMRIRRIALDSVRPGAVVDGPVVVQADNGFQIDNMEGLSVHRGPAGETVLTLVSDDNFSRLQRTLLLQFTLVEP
jgi:hypothetical protein